MAARDIPPHFRPIYSHTQIAERAAAIGREITPWVRSVYESTGHDVLAIAVLRGGMFFFTDIVRHIDVSVEVAPIQSWAYAQNEVMRSKVEFDIKDVSPKGRSILLVDDICDSGKTLAALSAGFRELGAEEIRSAVLIQRMIPDPPYQPDYIGFQYTGDEWFVGYGMDDNERWKNLPDIYIIERASSRE